MHSLKPTFLAILLPFALGAGAIAMAADGAATTDTPAASGPAASAAKNADSQVLEEVVVTGLRASLEKSLDIKKNADVVLDSINATELGRFPDADVADSLRASAGHHASTARPAAKASRVTVRGLGPQYNIVTLNNRILATDDDGRDLAFDVLPSEVISGADVLKSAAGLGARGQHRRHGEPAHRESVRQSGIARRCARRGRLQRDVDPARQQVLRVRRGHHRAIRRWASCSAPSTRTTRSAPIR